jgi:hypothetical protein
MMLFESCSILFIVNPTGNGDPRFSVALKVGMLFAK